MSDDLDFLEDIGEDWGDESVSPIEVEPVKLIVVSTEAVDTPAYSVEPAREDGKTTLNVEDEFVAVSESDQKEKEKLLDPLDPLAQMGVNRNNYPKLLGSEFPQPFLAISDGIIIQYAKLPKLNYGEIYAELSDLSVHSSPTPTLQVINDEIQKVQAAKDRLGELYCEVLRNYHFKKRAVDILEAAWSKYTLEKNAEKRKGDASFRISEFSIDFANVESLAKVCQHILKNLDSLHESLSRRITVNQLLLKLNDMGRGSLPISDFNSRPLADLVGGSLEYDESISAENRDEDNIAEVDEMTF